LPGEQVRLCDLRATNVKHFGKGRVPSPYRGAGRNLRFPDPCCDTDLDVPVNPNYRRASFARRQRCSAYRSRYADPVSFGSNADDRSCFGPPPEGTSHRGVRTRLSLKKRSFCPIHISQSSNWANPLASALAGLPFLVNGRSFGDSSSMKAVCHPPNLATESESRRDSSHPRRTRAAGAPSSKPVR
jgi:hypothetical protein